MVLKVFFVATLAFFPGVFFRVGREKTNWIYGLEKSDERNVMPMCGRCTGIITYGSGRRSEECIPLLGKYSSLRYVMF